MERVQFVGLSNGIRFNGTFGKLLSWKPEGPRWVRAEMSAADWGFGCMIDGVEEHLGPGPGR
eukprot:1821005-Prymnesium_polylepis.1